MHRVFLPVLLPVLIVLTLAVGGCGSDSPPPNQATRAGLPDRSKQSPSPDRLPSPTRATAPLATTPAVKEIPLTLPRQVRRVPGAIDTHLLPEDRMPSLAGGLEWVTESDGAENAESVGACQKSSMESIGAVTAVRRTYGTGDGSARAIQVVARFADRVSAWRANEVLEAWRADCEERLAYPRKAIGSMETVPVEAGIGTCYAAAYGPKAATKGQVAGFGIVRLGAYVSIVEIIAGAPRYPVGWDPARAAVRRIAHTFA